MIAIICYNNLWPSPSLSPTVDQVGDTDSAYSSHQVHVANSVEEDSDGELLDSTDWETSSGEEDGEVGETKSPEPKEARPKTFYIAREILTTERTYDILTSLFHLSLFLSLSHTCTLPHPLSLIS